MKKRTKATRKARAARGPRAADNPLYEISDRVRSQALTEAYHAGAAEPSARPLRIYTLDPSVSHRIGGTTTVNVPYEPLERGPVGSLFILDGSGAPPPLSDTVLDLDDRKLLLTDGVAPTPADARFHLQMAYAVCSLTYAAFQRALGRDVAWSFDAQEGEVRRRLRVRPFGMREDNAYYERTESAVAFGYFDAHRHPAGHVAPGGLIFSALSHDVLVHETTHALLDGVRAMFNAPIQHDVLGFHEGFADIVAMFQHFSYPEVVAAGIREGGGMLARASLLTDLAREFGYATSSRRAPHSMRTIVDVADPADFDADAKIPGKGLLRYRHDLEVHDMGSVLGTAVFEAFQTVFRRKTERYFRLAGIPLDAIARTALSADLVQLLAEEASMIAGHFLNICIRALDYCPAVDMELGEYLRAIITADMDLFADDPWGYREAFIDAFQRRGIFPEHVRFMSEDALRWEPAPSGLRIPGLAFERLRFRGDPGSPSSAQELERQARALGEFISTPDHAAALHLIMPGTTPLPKGVIYAAPPSIESIRCARRVSPDGKILFDLVAEIVQSCTGQGAKQPFDFFGGCTLIIGPDGVVRYTIFKRLDSAQRLDRQARAVYGPLRSFWEMKDGKLSPRRGTFRLLHRHIRAEDRERTSRRRKELVHGR
jgi:hypothetical protein